MISRNRRRGGGKESDCAASVSTAVLIAVTGVGTWRARYRGTELPLRPRVPGTFELSLPRGTEGVLELERV